MRRQHPRPDGDRGFTLIELLVVMIVIALLAAIAIPLFLGQRAKAHDASTKADVTTLGKELASYFVDGNGASIDYDVQPGRAVLTDGSTTTVVNLTNGTAKPVAGASLNLDDPDAWCLALTDPKGAVKDFSYSAQSGLVAGTC